MPRGEQISLDGTLAVGSHASIGVAIRYSKAHPSYVQRVTLEMRDGTSRTFGYDFAAWETTCCEVYAEAYARQWASFASLCAPGGDDEERSEARLSGYGRTFARLEQAAEVLGLA